MRRLTMIVLLVTVAVVCAQGQNMQWVRHFTGPGSEVLTATTIDAAGNSYAVGYFDNTMDADPGPGSFPLTSQGQSDAFIAKLDANGALQWAKRMGGGSNDWLRAVAVSATGEVVAMGEFTGSGDFDPGPGTTTLTSNGAFDFFLLKLDASGNLVWAKAFGSAGLFSNELTGNIILTPTGDILVTGSFQSTIDMDPGPGIANFTSNGGTDIFVSKFGSAGNFLWSKRVGGSQTDSPTDVLLDASGNIYYGGSFNGFLDLDPGPATLNFSSNGASDFFVSKLDPNGNFLWARTAGGTNSDDCRSVAIDGSGNIYMCGTFQTIMDFDPGPGTFSLTPSGIDPFICKWDGNGNFVWARDFPTSLSTVMERVVAEPGGSVIIAGAVNGTVDLDPGPGTQTISSSGNLDGFAVRLTSTGNYSWGFGVGGTNIDGMFDVVTDASGNAYLCGYFSGVADFDPGPGTQTLTSTGTNDGFLMQFGMCTRPSNLSGSPTVCQGSTANLQASGNGTLTWYAAASGGSPLATGSSFTTPALGGTTTYYVADTSCGGALRTAITVNVLPASQGSLTVSTCDTYTSPSGQVWTQSGIILDTIPNSVGCDSIVTIELTILSASSGSLSLSTCDPSITVNGQTYTQTGNYTQQLTNASGCDSTLSLSLTFLQATSATVTATACGSYTSPSGQVLTQSGTYLDTIPNSVGCDSVLTLVLTVTQVNAGVTNGGATLTAQASGAQYQWIYCDSAAVPGATGQSFTPTASGNYAVIVTQNNCTDTSACNAVIVNGLALPLPTPQLWPNPSGGVVHVAFDAWMDGDVTVRNAQGQVVGACPLVNGKAAVTLPAANGAYWVAVRSRDGRRGVWQVLRQ